MAKLKTLSERIKNNELPPPADFKTPEEVFEAYTNQGYEGALWDPEGQEQVQSEATAMGFGDAEQVARANGFEGQGKGKRSGSPGKGGGIATPAPNGPI